MQRGLTGLAALLPFRLVAASGAALPTQFGGMEPSSLGVNLILSHRLLRSDISTLRRVLLRRCVAEAVGAGSTECFDQVAGFVQQAGFAATFASDRRGTFGRADD